ncbi:MAG TPA: APC family permease [Terracidiphilus sp.]
MSLQTTKPAAAAGLRRNSLGMTDLVFQGITHIAPATNLLFAFPVIALKAGPDMPLSLVLATIIAFFICNTVSEFSRYMPSSGGYYSFATRGLGSRAGFMATWSFLVYEITGPAGCSGFLGYFLSDTLATQFDIHISWWPIALASFALIWTLTFYGVKLSARATAVLGGIELLVMLALCITFLIHPASGSSYTAPFKPEMAPHHLGGILAGMVFSVLALAGFEGIAPMAQEARQPGRFVSKAIILSLSVIGIFYIFTSYATAIGWGTDRMAGFAADPNPYFTLGHAFWGTASWLVVLAVINSCIGVGLACTNSVTRVMYTMGRAGTLPASFGTVHPVHQTPAFAIAVSQILGIIMALLVGFFLHPDQIFGVLETITTLSVIVLYVMANLALTFYIRREHPKDFSVWQHGVVPMLATFALIPVLFVTVYPTPDWPVSLTPYLYAISMIAGFIYMLWREWRIPGTLKRSAAMLLQSGL